MPNKKAVSKTTKSKPATKAAITKPATKTRNPGAEFARRIRDTKPDPNAEKKPAAKIPAPPTPKPPAAAAKHAPVAAKTAERRGIFFAVMNKHTQAVYEQNDHTLVLASQCRCRVQYAPGKHTDANGLRFEVVRSKSCPIDEHRGFDGRLAS